MATTLQIVQKFYPNVQSVRDSHRSVTLEVTKADTNTKAVKNHRKCALAIACKRQLKADAAIICVKTAYVIHGDKAIRYINPESVSREIASFDRNAGFEPGTYQLSKVSAGNSIGTKRAHKKRTGKNGAINYHRTENIRMISDAQVDSRSNPNSGD